MSCSETNKETYFEDTLIRAFRNQDFNEFNKIIITPEDMIAGLASNYNSTPDNRDLVETYRMTYLVDYKRIFDNILEEGEAIGINWNEIRFINFIYNVNDPISGSGLHLLNGHINIKVRDQHYFFYGIDAQKYKTGYKISYIKAIKKGILEKYVDSNNVPE